jgi:hypothetical protein
LINEDGFIAGAQGRVAFGFMVSDSNPESARGANARRVAKDWSLGDERVLAPQPPNVLQGNGNNNNGAPNKALPTSTAMSLNGWSFGRSATAIAPWNTPHEAQYLFNFAGQPINLGVQGEDAPAGRLIHAFQGVAASPSLLIGDNTVQQRSHNDWVREELRRVVPTGPSPLSAMLSDLYAYYQARPNACHTRVAVLLTDGAESTYMPAQSCQNKHDCTLGGFPGECKQVRLDASAHHERMTENAGNCGQNGCEKVCVYPDGAPYESAVHLARSLREDLSIPVIVATVGLPDAEDYQGNLAQMPPALRHAYAVALAGSPDMGPQAGMPGIYQVEMLQDQLSAEQLIQRVESAMAGGSGVRVETQPLVMGVAESDAVWGVTPDEQLRQWRLSGEAVTSAGDTYSYGAIELNKMGCEGVRASQAGLALMGSARYEDQVQLQARRPAFTARSQGVTPVIDTGNGDIFNRDGSVNGNLYRDPELLPSLDATKAKQVGLQTAGFFGARGLNNGEAARRGFGANLSGDLVALPPRPEEGVEANRAAPSLVISGADDGLIHVFRAFDGVELFAFVLKSAWAQWNTKRKAERSRADALLSAAHLTPCRRADGGAACGGNATTEARAFVVGAANEGGDELFGFEVGFEPSELRRERPELTRWPVGAAMWSLTSNSTGLAKLGKAVSRPALTYVRVGDQVRALMIVGCGDDTDYLRSFTSAPSKEGRCVLFIDVATGELVKRFDGDGQLSFTFPVVGSPSVYPGGEATAEQLYVGDKAGQLWRVDLTSAQPNEWRLRRLWPLEAAGAQNGAVIAGPNAVDVDRGLGFAVHERPSLSRAANNDLVVIFATSGERAPSLPQGFELADQGYMVSLRERSGLDEQGNPYLIITPNWALDFAPSEGATGAPSVKDNVAYLTTSRTSANQVCGQAVGKEGRLYGVHYTKRLNVDYNDPFGARTLNVVPMLPRYTDTGERAENALSLVLPPGRTAHGFALVPTPSCAAGVGTMTELILNLTDEQGVGADLALNGLQVEFVRGLSASVGEVGNEPDGGAGAMSVEQSALGEALQVKMSGQLMSIGLAPPEGSPQGVMFNPVAPFPSRVLYWGSVDGE